MHRILLTTTSFQDTPGAHHELLESHGFEIIRERGPLSESRMLELVGEVDAFLCGDDDITRRVIEQSLPRLKAISKYGIGLDKIDVAAATELNVPVLFTPGVNHTTVAEHTFCLLLAVVRNLVPEANYVREGKWKRITGNELYGKKLGIVGLGRIGREVAVRARAFGMELLGYGNYWDDAFAAGQDLRRVTDLDELLAEADVVSLHTKLTDQTRHLLDQRRLALMKESAVIINCARGELIDRDALIDALEKEKIAGYGADVLDQEPPPADHPLLRAPNVVITPHIGSRTYENVVRQAGMAVENLALLLAGKEPLAQANRIERSRT